MKLSVLDQSVISKGSSAREALENTIALAQITEKLGYYRFWVAEHHNTNGIAGTSPQVLISRIASATEKIRIGSGAVSLPQYSPYKIAEDFKVLEALFPNRIDLGVGRSPGGSTNTRLALTDGIRKSLNEFPRQVKDLQRYLTGTGEHTNRGVRAYPITDSFPEIWVMGNSGRGALTAAEAGAAFTFGHFIKPNEGQRAIAEYYKNFQPSALLAAPKVNVCIFAVCAPTQEMAEEWALSQDLWLLSVEQGIDTRIVSIKEAKRQSVNHQEKLRIKENRKRMIIGTPEKIKDELHRLSEIYQTEEFIIVTNLYEFRNRMQSYTLLGEIMRK